MIEKVEFAKGGEVTNGYFKLDHKSGEIEYSLTAEIQDEWTVVFTDWGFSRMMFDNSTNEVDCKTTAWAKNKLALEGNKFGKCALCKYAVWVDNKRPACQDRLNLKGYIDGDVERPVFLTLKGASYKAGSDFLESTNGRFLFDALYTVKAGDLQKRGAVEYRSFKITEVEKLDAKEVEKWKAQAEKDLLELEETRKAKADRDFDAPVDAERVADIMGGEVVEDESTPEFLKGA